MKRKVLTLVLGLLGYACYGQIKLDVFPQVIPALTSSMSFTTPEILKMSWGANIGNGYIIQHSKDLNGQWELFSTETAYETVNRRSVVFGDSPVGYYRISQVQSVQNPVVWSTKLSGMSNDVLQQCTAYLTFDDGSITNLTGTNINQAIVSKTYDSLGLKTIQVMVTNTSGWSVSGQSAVQISSIGNLVLNSDFEQSSNSLPLNWKKGGYGINTSTFAYPVLGYNSSSAAKITVINYVSGDSKWVFNNIQVSGGDQCVYSDVYMSSVTTDVTIEYTLANGSKSYGWLSSPPPATTWQTTSATFTVPTNVVSLTVFHDIPTNGVLTIDQVSVKKSNGLAQGMVSFQFDDGIKDTMINSVGILDQYGYKGTYFIYTSEVNTSDTVSQSDILSLQNTGHEVAGHTVSHPHLTTLSIADIEREVNIGRELLLSWGAKPVLSFAYPYGEYNDIVKKVAREAGFSCAGTTDDGLNGVGMDAYSIKRTSLRSTDTVASVTSLIDQAIINKQWFVIVFHHVDSTITDYSLPPVFLQSVADYVHSKNVKVVTMQEGFSLIR